MDFGELRKRAKDGQAFDPPTVLALLNEIERLRRERVVLAAAVRGWGDYQNAVRKYGLASVEVARVLEGAQRRHKSVLALLDGGKAGDAK